MIGKLIKWGLIILIGILVYNYFYGTDKERETSAQIFQEVKELGGSVKDALSQEKKRFEEGKYDGLVNKLDGVWEDIKSNLSSNTDPEQITRLEREKEQLETDLKAYDGTNDSSKRQLLGDLERFIDRADSLLRERGND